MDVVLSELMMEAHITPRQRVTTHHLSTTLPTQWYITSQEDSKVYKQCQTRYSVEAEEQMDELARSNNGC